jgi:hypothetical protein
MHSARVGGVKRHYAHASLHAHSLLPDLGQTGLENRQRMQLVLGASSHEDGR